MGEALWCVWVSVTGCVMFKGWGCVGGNKRGKERRSLAVNAVKSADKTSLYAQPLDRP